MIYWLKNLPEKEIDLDEWKPFIKSKWFREKFMIYVYMLMAFFIMFSIILHIFDNHNIIVEIFVWILVFLIHELIHIVIIFSKGDISITHKGIFFWINTNSILSRTRFFLFMSMPIWMLTVLPLIFTFFVDSSLKDWSLIVSWFNLIIASSDIINTLLLIIKPKNAIFCRGFYKLK